MVILLFAEIKQIQNKKQVRGKGDPWSDIGRFYGNRKIRHEWESGDELIYTAVQPG